MVESNLSGNKGFPLSSILINQSMTDESPLGECGYCDGRRYVHRNLYTDRDGKPLETPEVMKYEERNSCYYQHSFRSYKVKAMDFE